MIIMDNRNVPWRKPTMLPNGLIDALGHSERHARYERPRTVRQRAVAIDNMSGFEFYLTETNDPQVPLR